jgi:site-specific DNA-methyltransferase (adenine-specific)
VLFPSTGLRGTMGHHFREGDVPSYQLFHGDCLVEMDKIPDKSVDMAFVDLPYSSTQNIWDSMIPLEKLWAQYKRICTGAIVLTASQPFTSIVVCSNIKNFKHEWVWIKNRGSNFANTVREPFKEHESVLVFSYGKWTYNKQMQERTGGGRNLIGKKVGVGKEDRTGIGKFKEFTQIESLSELRVPSSWQKFNTQVGKHPNQKPVPMAEYFIKTYSNTGDTVLDNTMGSGSTGEACAVTGRNFIGIELYPFLDRPIDKKTNPNYFFEAEERIQKAYAQYQSPIP